MSALNASASTGMFCVASSTGLCIHASSSSPTAAAAAPCGSHGQGCAFQPILVSIASSLPTVVTRSAQFYPTRFSVSASSWISRSNRSSSKRRLQVQAKKDELSPIRTVPVQVAHELINAGHHYLDVRTPEEYAAGHVEGSINIPYMVKLGPGMIKNAKFVEEVSQEFDKDDEIVVACQSGRRSMMAVTELRAVNFSGVTDMGGGYSAWKESGLPLQTQRSQQAHQA
ncbi:unnamed protein product [Sphagnum jensenii]|uniref:Rhodanese domain-containing protein n=1 Tax=Sphagnum jensenii TaxID=128206 RepID=A0ABP1B9P2_9BRYO